MRSVTPLLRRLILLCIGARFMYLCAYPQDTLPLRSGHIPALDPYVYTLEDSSAQLSPTEVYRRFRAGEGHAQHGSFFNFGYSHSVFWVMLPVRNEASAPLDLYYTVADPHLNRLELFSVSPGGMIRSIDSTGDLRMFGERPLYHKNFVFPLHIAPRESQTYLLKIDNRGYTTAFPLSLAAAADHHRATQSEYLLWGIITGILVFVCIFSFFMFASLGDRLYLFYGLYVAVTVLYIWCNNGLGYQFFWSDHPLVASRIRLILGAVNGFFILHNMQLFVGQNRQNGRPFYVPTLVIKGLLLLLAALLFIPYDFTKDHTLISVVLSFSDLVFFGGIFLLFAGLIQKIIQKQEAAWYYLIAVLFMCTGFTLQLLVRQVVLPASPVTLNGLYIGIVMEVLVLTFGITRRYNSYTKERDRLREELRENEKQEAIRLAIAKERERKRIAADMHDDLGAALSGLKLMSELSTRKNTLEELKNDTRNISKSAEELTFKMKEIVWTLDNESDNLENLLLYIQKYGTGFFSGTPIRFEMPLPLDIPYAYFPGEERRHIYLAVKEIFNNALKHSNASRLTCEVVFNGHFVFHIHDDGQGFDVQQAKGNGLRNIRQRMEIIGGTVAMDVRQGVHIRLEIPLKPVPHNSPNG